MTAILGIHGIAKEQLGRRQLLELWRPAIGDGCEQAIGRPVELPDIDIVFYGDLFLPTLTPGWKGEPDRGWWEGIDEDEAVDLLEAASEVVTDDEMAEAGAAPSKAYTRMPRPLQAVAGAIGRKFGAAAVVLFFGGLRQVRRYLSDPALRTEVDRRVDAKLLPACRVLVGHSLGSVVAYECACRYTGGELPLLLTVGSPLGLKFVRERLSVGPVVPSAAVASGRSPQVQRWVNVYDPRDPVACSGPLRRWWPVVDDFDVRNGGDAHEATRYLGKRATGAAIVAAIGRLA